MEFPSTQDDSRLSLSSTQSVSSVRSSQRKRKRPRCYACLTSLGDVNHSCFGSPTTGDSPVRKKPARGSWIDSTTPAQEDTICMNIDSVETYQDQGISYHQSNQTAPIQDQYTMLPGNNDDKTRGPPPSSGPPTAQDAPPKSLAPPPMMTAMPNMRRLHGRNSQTTIKEMNEEKKKRPTPNFNVFVPKASPSVATQQPQQSQSQAQQQMPPENKFTPMAQPQNYADTKPPTSYPSMQQQQQMPPSQGYGSPPTQQPFTPAPTMQQ